MSWSIAKNGTRAAVIEHATAESVRQCNLGYMTEAQAALVQVAIAAVPGGMVSINVSGHNSISGPETGRGTGSFSLSVSAYEELKKVEEQTEGVTGHSVAAVGSPQ